MSDLVQSSVPPALSLESSADPSPEKAGIPAASPSAEAAVAIFDTPAAAAKYARALEGTATDRRERRAIARAIAGLPDGAHLLDCPCGAGRLTSWLLGRGFAVTAADSSAHMLDRLRDRIEPASAGAGKRCRLVHADARRLPFDADAFDGVVTNRLLHHIYEPEARRRILRELRRVCRGPIVASFFRSGTLDGARFHARARLRGAAETDRVPIALRTIRADAEAAGLEVQAVVATRPLISKQTYLVLRRAAREAA